LRPTFRWTRRRIHFSADDIFKPNPQRTTLSQAHMGDAFCRFYLVDGDDLGRGTVLVAMWASNPKVSAKA
jgi:hypothetical protein